MNRRAAPPIVIAHRGASGHRPEHTLESYRLAIALGADFIEPDLVATRDGQLVARHENEITGTTDVADHAEFAARRTEKVIDGVRVHGFFTEDFTLAELKTLRARERLPGLRPGNCAFDGAFEVPSFDEILALVAAETRARGRRIGIYPETKHPSYFRGLGLALEPPLLAAVHGAGYVARDAPIFIQSFETRNLEALRRETEVPLVQLIDLRGAPFDAVTAGESLSYADLVTPQGLARLAAHVSAIGVHKQRIVPWGTREESLAATGLIEAAHALDLGVHAWTFRAENCFLPSELRSAAATGDLPAELETFFALGVDGVFADQPEVAVAVRARRGSG